MDLKELIALNKKGRSYEQLARDCGGVVTSQRLQQLGTTKLKEFPTTEVLRGLARGLTSSEAAVVMAVAESLGLDVRRAAPKLMELMPAAAWSMTDRQALAVAELIRAFVDERAGDGDEQRDATSIEEQADVYPIEPTVKEVRAAQARQREMQQMDAEAARSERPPT